MAREIVKQLEGRERELITNAAMQVQIAMERMKQAEADGLVRDEQYKTLLEMATGEEETTGLTLNLATGEVYRETDEPPKKRKPRRRATGKKPRSAGKKRGGN